MWKISVIGEKSDLDKHKSAMKFSEFKVDFVEKKDFETADFDQDVALVFFPWEGYSKVFAYPQFKKFVDQHSVVVVGPAIYFFEVEDKVIDGSVCFLSHPVNSMQIESVLSEIRRIHGFAFGQEAKSFAKNSA